MVQTGFLFCLNVRLNTRNSVQNTRSENSIRTSALTLVTEI